MKNNMVKMIAVFSIFSTLLSAVETAAQGSFDGEQMKREMIADWQRAKAYTNEYLNSMPADKYSYRTVDSIRSFAQQMLHLAQANLFLVGTATGVTKNFGRNLEASNTAVSMDSVKYFVNASYDFAIDAIGKMDASKFGEKVTMRNRETSRFSFLSKAFEHQTHHRGQTTIYIRMLGIRPPAERLF